MALKIQNCLLDSRNEYIIGDTTVGAKIASMGRTRYWAQREFKRIDTVVIHYISAMGVDRKRLFDLGLILDVLCTCGVSAHYLIDRQGGIYRLVPETKKAWHCGPSRMPLPDNRLGVNDFSIGIELMGAEHRMFTKPQYVALRDLCLDIEKRHRKEMTYVGHEEIAGVRAVELGLRKEPKCDPGPRFSWEKFESMLRGDPSDDPTSDDPSFEDSELEDNKAGFIVPESAPPEFTEPDAPALDSTAPNSIVPEDYAPEVCVPNSDIPNSNMPDNNAPEDCAQDDSEEVVEFRFDESMFDKSPFDDEPDAWYR